MDLAGAQQTNRPVFILHYKTCYEEQNRWYSQRFDNGESCASITLNSPTTRSPITVNTREKQHDATAGAMVYTLVHNNIAVIILKFTKAEISNFLEWEEQPCCMLRTNTWKMVFMIETHKHSVDGPSKNQSVPHKCCNTRSECLCIAISMLHLGYKSQVIVESSHIVACINWKGHMGAWSPGPSKSPMRSPAMLASGHAFKLYIDDSPW